jgi:ribosomal protein S17E
LFESNYIFHFKKWQCIRHTNITENTLNIDITNIYRNVYNPVWLFVIFQTNRSNNQLKVNGIFDHVNVRNLWMEIGWKHYPEESLDLDWDHNKYCLADDAFQDFNRILIKTDWILYVAKNMLKYYIQYIASIYQTNLKVYQAQNVILYFMSTLTKIFQHQVELIKELTSVLL